MPLTFITSFYGMNLEIPEFKWGLWGYALVWILMAVCSLLMLLYFRKKKLI